MPFLVAIADLNFRRTLNYRASLKAEPTKGDDMPTKNAVSPSVRAIMLADLQIVLYCSGNRCIRVLTMSKGCPLTTAAMPAQAPQKSCSKV